MKINQIKCDRCGRVADANQPNGIGGAAVKLYRTDEASAPAIVKQLDLCDPCLAVVEIAINDALTVPVQVRPAVHTPRPQ